MPPQLIYDVGMHNGEDTAYYLREGFRVVGIEANPVLSAKASKRFAREIASGQLTVVNAAINKAPGRATFWICDSQPVWSSFSRELATRSGAIAHPIEVECVTFDLVVSRFGRAHYIKIDIEGHDEICLAQLTPELCPDYISIEFGFDGPAAQLRQLHGLGYRQFKLICQNFGWLDVSARSMHVFAMRSGSLMMRAVRKGLVLSQFLKPVVGKYPFRAGSSGPIGSRTPGRWVALEEAMVLADRLVWFDREQGSQGIGWWFDIHATGRA